ncbi:MAG: hypothetical protein HUU32_04350 [Calditrichaceae bacterium]|nr:hypothetical protein [Calditrichia bacterium]NUQ40608.1 hypothetical protein [Calditrichaceae bacterium]
MKKRNFRYFIFWSLMILVVIIVFEWCARVYYSWRVFQNEKAGQLNADYRLALEKTKRVDLDIGVYSVCDSEITLVAPEFVSRYKTIDLGVDSLRFRDDGINRDAEKVILALGDSYVQAVQVNLEETFTECLEALYHQKVDVINSGILGISPQRKMSALCDSLDVSFNDLTDELIQYAKQGKRLYFSKDVHFTPEGHKCWAEIVYRVLEQQKPNRETTTVK